MTSPEDAPPGEEFARSSLKRLQPTLVPHAPELPLAIDVAGQKELDRIAEQFGSELADESARIARRMRSRTVGPEYVRMAADRLGMSAGRWAEAGSTFGGILFGGGISGFVSMAAAGSWPPQGVTASVVATVLGSFALGISLRR